MAIFSILAPRMAFILHIMIVLNVIQHLPALQGLKGSFNNLKNAFLNDPKSQKEVFGQFLEFRLLGRLDIPYYDSTKRVPSFCNVTRS